MRLQGVFAVALAWLLAAMPAWGVDLAREVGFNVPPGPLAAAVVEFSKQAEIQVLGDGQKLDAISTKGVRGRYTIGEGLKTLLDGTGFGFRVRGTNTISLTSAVAANPGALPPDARASDGRAQPQERIMVTARKTNETLLDVPVPVTVVKTDTLADNSQLRLQDYYTKVPGLNLMTISDGSPIIAIRGVVAGGQTASTVGIVIDDVPYGGSINPGSPARPPDIDPGDLARLEVLRGPQGTLYGATSIGGLIKYVTLDPSFAGVSGRVQAGYSRTTQGDSGYTIRGGFNAPLGETLAIRASGFSTRDPGFVDNVLSGEKDINRRDSHGGRASALWRASNDLSVKLTASVQKSTRDGNADVDTALGDGLLQRALPETGIYERGSQTYSAHVDWRVGNVDVTSITAYNYDKVSTRGDLSALGALANANFPGAMGVTTPYYQRVDKFTQELRGSFRLGSGITWVLGGFYANEDYDTHFEFLAANAVTGATMGTLLVGDDSPTYKEYAGFSTINFDITDRFDVQVGGRASQNRQTFSSVRSGPLQPIFYPGAAVVPVTHSKDTAYTYLVAPRFRVHPDLMVYARAASGYRPGGPNVNCGLTIPCQYDADTSQNYEVGVKGAVGRAFAFDASLYYIDWKDVQISLRDPATTVVYAANAGRAESKGVEVAVTLRPTEDLSVTLSGAYGDAELSEDFPPTTFNAVGRKGDRLPYSSKFSGSLSIDQRFKLWQAASASVGATVSHVGSRLGRFVNATTVRQNYPEYTQVDLRAGLWFDRWQFNLFVNNAGDERGILNGGVDAVRPTFFTYIQPRTYGINATWTF